MLDSVSILSGLDALAQWSPAIAARSAFEADSAWAAQLPGEAENAQAARREGLPAVAVDGPGFLVLRDGAQEVYARSARFQLTDSGQLIDERGRAVLGYRDDNVARPVRVAIAPTADTRWTHYRIDEKGSLIRVTQPANAQARQLSHSTELARLCVAIFPASDRLAQQADGTLRGTIAAGTPVYARAGDANAGQFRSGAAEFDATAVQHRLHDLWLVNGKAALDVALASAADGFSRIALNLVK